MVLSFTVVAGLSVVVGLLFLEEEEYTKEISTLHIFPVAFTCEEMARKTKRPATIGASTSSKKRRQSGSVRFPKIHPIIYCNIILTYLQAGC